MPATLSPDRLDIPNAVRPMPAHVPFEIPDIRRTIQNSLFTERGRVDIPEDSTVIPGTQIIVPIDLYNAAKDNGQLHELIASVGQPTEQNGEGETPAHSGRGMRTVTFVLRGIQIALNIVALADGVTQVSTYALPKVLKAGLAAGELVGEAARSSVGQRILGGMRSVAGRIVSLFVGAEAPKEKEGHGKERHDKDKHAEDERKLEEQWKRERPMYKKIKDVGMQAYVNELSNKRDIFLPEYILNDIRHKICTVCADEGIRKMNDGGEELHLFKMAGSGILSALARPDKDPFSDEIIENVARYMLKQGIKIFTGHIGCGAAKVVYEARKAYLKKIGEDKQLAELEAMGLDAFTKKWTEAVGERMREISGDKDIKTAFVDKLDRPASGHPGDAIYLAQHSTGFRPSFEGLPQGYVESVVPGDVKNALARAEALLGIAFGDHGVGKKLKENPEEYLLLCCVAEDQAELDIMLKAVRAYIAESKTMSAEWKARIRVDGFVKRRPVIKKEPEPSGASRSATLRPRAVVYDER